MPTPNIADLFSIDGPFVSAYVETFRRHEDGAQALAIAWKNARRALDAEGADEDTLKALDRAVGVDTVAVERGPHGAFENHKPHTGNKPRDVRNVLPDDAADLGPGDVLALIGAGGQAVVKEFLPEVHGAGEWRLGLLPWVTPLLEAEQQRVPLLCVLADRRGADVYGYGPEGGFHVEVEGPYADDERIERNDPGGWSQRRYQQHAIDAWEKDAEAVAQEVAALAERTGAQLVAIGGDVHAVRLVQQSMPERFAPLVRTLEHGTRAAGGDEELLQAELRRLMRSRAAEQTVALLETFREEKGQADRAADGPAAVVENLQMALVDTLLVQHEPDDERTAWFGPEPLQLALAREDVEAMGVQFPLTGHLVDVVVRAAVGSGAAVRIVPREVLTGGMGALLRAHVRPTANVR
jgi:hypothetical protein